MQSNNFWKKEHFNVCFLKGSHNICLFLQRNDLWCKLLVLNWASAWGKMKAKARTQYCRIALCQRVQPKAHGPLLSHVQIRERSKEHLTSLSHLSLLPQTQELISLIYVMWMVYTVETCLIKLGVVVHICNPSTWRWRQECHKFEDHIAGLHLTTTTTTKCFIKDRVTKQPEWVSDDHTDWK
jgi:hypothetical protein